MDGSKRTLYLLVSLCVFLAALGVSAAGLATRYSENLRGAHSTFQALQSSASRAMAQSGPTDEAWRSAAKRFYRSDDSILLIALHAPGQGVLHMVPRSAPYLSQPPETASALPELLFPPQTVSRLSAVVGTQSGSPVTLDVLYSLLRQRDVYEAARLGLLIAASWTALSLLAVTIAGLRRKPPDSSFSRTVSGFPDLAPGLADADFDLPSFSSGAAEANPSGAPSPGHPGVGNPDRASGIPGTLPSTLSPKGLYSPDSGLGWEEYLPERLSSELSRAASFEQDLVLLLLSHDGIARSSPSFHRIQKTLLEFFAFRDLAFEQGPSGFAVILPNMDCEHALRRAEEFLKKITSLLRGDEGPQDHRKVFLGLSSRSGRLVDAERLLKEARAALARARDEADSRIVAFKADPNKYRAYLAGKE